jgi:hypothetical protein
MSRTLSVLRLATKTSDGLLAIQDNDRVLYLYREVECVIGGRSWAVSRLAGLTYHVRIGQFSDCDCWGFLAYNRCRHLSVILAMDKLGLL